MKRQKLFQKIKLLAVVGLLSIAAACMTAFTAFAAESSPVYSAKGNLRAYYQETGVYGDLAEKETNAARKEFHQTHSGVTVEFEEYSEFITSGVALPVVKTKPTFATVADFTAGNPAEMSIEAAFTPKNVGINYANEFKLQITDAANKTMTFVFRVRTDNKNTAVYYDNGAGETAIALNQQSSIDGVGAPYMFSLGFRLVYTSAENGGFVMYTLSKNPVNNDGTVIPAPQGFDPSSVTMKMGFSGLTVPFSAIKIYSLGGSYYTGFESISSTEQAEPFGGSFSVLGGGKLEYGKALNGDILDKTTSAKLKSYYLANRGILATLEDGAKFKIENFAVPTRSGNTLGGGLYNNSYREQTALELVFMPKVTQEKYAAAFTMKFTDANGKSIALVYRSNGANTLLYYDIGEGEKQVQGLNQQCTLEGVNPATKMGSIGARVGFMTNGVQIFDLYANTFNKDPIPLPSGFDAKDVSLEVWFDNYEEGITETCVKIYTVGGVRMNGEYDYYHYGVQGLFPQALAVGEEFVPEVYFKDNAEKASVKMTDVFGNETLGKVPSFGDYTYTIFGDYHGKKYEKSGSVRIFEKQNGQIQTEKLTYDLSAYDVVIPETIAADALFDLLPDSFSANGAKLTFEVKNAKGEAVSVSENKFTPSATGEYTIAVTAISRFNQTTNKTYTVTAVRQYTGCVADLSSLKIAYKDGAQGLTYGDTLKTVVLSGGVLKSGDTVIAGVFAFVAEDLMPSYADGGKVSVLLKFVPNDANVGVDYQGELEISVLQAAPVVENNPDFVSGKLLEGDNIPTNALLFKDINGKILEGKLEFKDAVLKAGSVKYAYTFTPVDKNYKTAEGEIEFTAEKIDTQIPDIDVDQPDAKPEGGGCNAAAFGGFGAAASAFFLAAGALIAKKRGKNEK